jgi:hypothetical protein
LLALRLDPLRAHLAVGVDERRHAFDVEVFRRRLMRGFGLLNEVFARFVWYGLTGTSRPRRVQMRRLLMTALTVQSNSSAAFTRLPPCLITASRYCCGVYWRFGIFSV